MNQPTISIVTPSYNQDEFLGDTIASIHSQGYGNLEHVVIDGGSTDGSLEKILEHQHQFSHWCSESDEGQSDAINKGFAHTTGDIMAWLNSDDVLEDGALEIVADTFAKHPDVQWMIGSARLFGGRFANEKVRTTTHVNESTLMAWMEAQWFPQQATFWRRSLWERSGELDPSLHYLMDWDLWLRFYSLAPTPLILDDVLAGYRFHDAAKCTNQDAVLAEEQLIHKRIQSAKSDSLYGIYLNESQRRQNRLHRSNFSS